MPKINHEEYEILKSLDEKWKWIARDKDRGLYAITEKPVRKYGPSPYWGTETEEDYSALELFDEKHLFQFIQWEDEEPYSIAELIEEYEKENESSFTIQDRLTPMLESLFEESEETEVKKDIEWLKEETSAVLREVFNNHALDYVKYIEVKRQLERLFAQLDEPEVLSQEFIDEHKKSWQDLSITGYSVPESALQNLLVPKQELPVIPKFVAEWIESRKNNYPFDVIGVYQRMNESFANEKTREVLSWIHETQLNRDSFARAWTDGFTVEEEQKYYAKIKGHENIGSNDKYWNYNTDMEELSIGDSEVHPNVISEYTIKATKEEWANLGITDDNAEFVLVEELEE